MNIDEYVMRETIRQSGTLDEAVGMKKAVRLVSQWDLDKPGRVLYDCGILIKGSTGYRTTPVYFANGSITPPTDVISGVMREIMAFVQSHLIYNKMDKFDADLVCKEILIIHPWQNGNGRIVSVFRNWLLGTLDDPEMLPYYFNENTN